MFKPSEWENRGQSKKLRGYRIIIRQYNSGKDSNFYLEAWGDSYACLRGERPAPSVGRTIPGKGSAARCEAIRQAKSLAESGLYNDD